MRSRFSYKNYSIFNLGVPWRKSGATIFTVGFANKIPTGALLLVSDQPMIPEGVKTSESDTKVTSEFVDRHLAMGILSLKQLINNGDTVKHLRF